MPAPDRDNIDALLSEAVQHHRSGKLGLAERLYNRIVSIEPEHAEALAMLGAVAGQSGRLGPAIELLRKAIGIDPTQPDHHASLGHALRRAGRNAEAVGAYKQALVLDPQRFGVLMHLAHLQRLHGDSEAALQSYEAATRANPNEPAAHSDLAATLHTLGRTDEAVRALQRAIELDNTVARRYANLASYFLVAGDAKAALDACSHCLEIDPHDTVALAYEGAALARLGRESDWRFLVDHAGLVRQKRATAPAHFEDIRAFNTALAAEVASHASLRSNPELLATRGGRQTDELQGTTSGPLREFIELTQRAIQWYLAGLDEDPLHPYRAHKPRAWELVMWAVVLDAQGHQISHVHGDGWVSGVYYAALPDTLGDSPGEPAGWLAFGDSPEELPAHTGPEPHLVKPQEGVFTLFPSYFYHHTLPFSSETQRISIAFDALPKWDA